MSDDDPSRTQGCEELMMFRPRLYTLATVIAAAWCCAGGLAVWVLWRVLR